MEWVPCTLLNDEKNAEFPGVEFDMSGIQLEEIEEKGIRILEKTLFHKLPARYDGLVLPYNRELAGTNAFIVGGDGRLCAIMNVMPREGKSDVLYLTMEAGIT